MANKIRIKQKEIQIQKPAQSLSAFQRKVASGADDRTILLKGFIIAASAILVGIVIIVTWRMVRGSNIRHHEAALAALITEVEGDIANPTTPEEKEQKMREALPRLEEIAKNAPASRKAVANGYVSTWKLQLSGIGDPLPEPTDPWSRLRLAQRSIVIGQAQEAADILLSLHRDAKPDRAWAQPYWSTLMQLRQLQGNREQAIVDYSEYRRLFKNQADLEAMDKMLNAI